MFVFSTGDVEFDIESLYKAVPQLAKVFRIIDKIGEGQCCVVESFSQAVVTLRLVPCVMCSCVVYT